MKISLLCHACAGFSISVKFSGTATPSMLIIFSGDKEFKEEFSHIFIHAIQVVYRDSAERKLKVNRK